MLSRVAERMYWLGRYLSRTENTARLINVHANLLLDLPKSACLEWEDLTDVIDSRDGFLERFQKRDEREVLRFMLADKQNTGSLINSMAAARENIRTTREILPSEAWEQVNEMYLFGKENLQKGLSRSGRHDYLDSIINSSHQIKGLIHACMSHDYAYNFIQIGSYLEGADMASRIIDVGSANLHRLEEDDLEAFKGVLWMNILRSLSAFQSYRQYVPDKVNGIDVVEFLLNDERFPRSIRFCLYQMESVFYLLPRHKEILVTIEKVRNSVARQNSKKLVESGKLHSFIDKLQLDINKLHSEITENWFDIT